MQIFESTFRSRTKTNMCVHDGKASPRGSLLPIGVGQIPHRRGLAAAGAIGARVVVAVLARVGDAGDGLEGVLGDLGEHGAATAEEKWKD